MLDHLRRLSVLVLFMDNNKGSRRGKQLGILLGEIFVELFDFIQQGLKLVSWWEDGHSERHSEEEA